MAQRMDKTTITKLLRVTWEAVAKPSSTWWPRTSTWPGSRTCTASGSTRSASARGTVTSRWWPTTTLTAPWCGPSGKDTATLEAFYDELG